MAFKANNWNKFPKDFGFTGSAGVKEVRFMAHGGKVSKGAIRGKPDPAGESPSAPPGLKNTDVPKFAIITPADKSKDGPMAGKPRLGSPSHGKGAKTPGGTRMPKAKGGAVKKAKGGKIEARAATPPAKFEGALAAPRSRGGSLPTLSTKPRLC